MTLEALQGRNLATKGRATLMRDVENGRDSTSSASAQARSFPEAQSRYVLLIQTARRTFEVPLCLSFGLKKATCVPGANGGTKHRRLISSSPVSFASAPANRFKLLSAHSREHFN